MGSFIQGVSRVYSPSNMWSPSSTAKRNGTSGCKPLSFLAHFSAVLKGTSGSVNLNLCYKRLFCYLLMYLSSHGLAEMAVVDRLILSFVAGPSKH